VIIIIIIIIIIIACHFPTKVEVVRNQMKGDKVIRKSSV